LFHKTRIGIGIDSKTGIGIDSRKHELELKLIRKTGHNFFRNQSR
jgi:hypothetical protein